jgi:hypothetical protein
MSVERDADHVLGLYRERVHPFLKEHGVTNFDSLERGAELIRESLQRKKNLTIGFLGEAQVGKSTLINALLGKPVLPSGGIGPLTAQATRVEYGAENSFEVTYHSRQQLDKVRFTIEGFLRRSGQLSQAAPSADSPPEGEKGATPSQPLFEADEDEPPSPEMPTRKEQHCLNQAKLMFLGAVRGDEPEATPLLLLEALRATLGQTPMEPASDLARFADRINEIQQKLGQHEHVTQTSLDSADDFDWQLWLRAADWMAPLVSRLRVRLSSGFVEQLALVDLPGVGILGDPAGDIAGSFVRSEGDALVLVFRNSGFTESVAKLLEETGVITRLLFGGRDGQPSFYLAIVITGLDQVVRERLQRGVPGPKRLNQKRQDPNQLFRELAEDMEGKLRQQLRDALCRTPAAIESKGADLGKKRELIIEQLCQSIRIVCTSAPDYLAIHDGISDYQIVSDAESTGVPRLREELAALAREAEAQRQRAIQATIRDFKGLMSDHLRSVRELYAAGGGLASVNWERFREQIEAAARPLKEQMNASHAELLATLRKSLHERIDLLCAEAELHSLKRLRSLKKHGEGLHFQSLNAALRRNGIWDKRSINYPKALTLAFVDTIAASWEERIVEAVREEVRNMADRDLKLVEHLCAFAQSHDERLVAEAHIDMQKKILRQNARNCIAWTKERLEQLRSRIHDTLHAAVSKPISAACQRAIKAGRNEGHGAMRGVLDAFEEGGSQALDAARTEAQKLLREPYNELIKELSGGYLKEHHDPIAAALDSLTSEEILRARRSDAQHRRRVFDDVDQLVTVIAPLPAPVAA